MQEVIVAFDTREMWLDTGSFWPLERRKLYLLKQDVTKPLSVDTTVWCSVFEIESDINQYRSPDGYPPRTIVWENIPRSPAYQTTFWDAIFSVDYHLGLASRWWNLTAMRQALSDGWGQTWKPCWMIAITELMDDDDAQKLDGIADPRTISPDWKLLGYDVLGGGTGFLTNAGYTDDEIDDLNKTILPCLNEHHLFPTRDSAEAHFDTIYQREPTHGEFTINGIYLIEAINVERT